MARDSFGSSTLTTWKRRTSAGSGSMNFLYSAHVVAAMVRSLPRASAGLSRFAASPVPCAPPAPISVCASSMNKMMGLGEACTSSITWRRRFSNSPFMLAPAWSRPMSSTRTVTSLSEGGTSPEATRCAKPSTTAVFPTPASPVRMGLFCRRRSSTWMIWRISSSRPEIGSISPERARSVRSVEKRASASCLPSAAGLIAEPSLPDAGAREHLHRACLRRLAEQRRELLDDLIELELEELFRDGEEGVLQRARLQPPDQKVAAPHLTLAEGERRVDPAALDRLLHLDGEIGDRGRAAWQAIERVGEVARERAESTWK